MNFDQIIEKYEDHPFFEVDGIDGIDAKAIDGDSLLTKMVILNDQNAVTCLVKLSVQVNQKGDMGNTALHEAVEKSNYEIVKILIAHGADFRIKNEFGDTPADIAMLQNEDWILELLQ